MKTEASETRYREGILRVLALTPHEKGISPGQRYRIEQWEPALEKLGVSINYSTFSHPELSQVLYQPGNLGRKAGGILGAYLKQLRSVARASRFDLVYVFREAALIGPAFLESIACLSGVPMVFDFDDAIFLRYKSPSNGYLSYLKFSGKTRRLCRNAREVMAGNDYLACWASRHNTRVNVVPTTIDTDSYRPELRRPNGALPTVGWTGSHSTRAHLELAVPALERLAAKRRFRFVAIGAEAPRIAGAVVESRPWRAATEVSDLADIDVGIMPLPDDPWCRGKCGFKALQYMGLGIPAVVSPVGANARIVAHGRNGFWAGTENDWVSVLFGLLEDRDLRARVGGEGRRTVETLYSTRVVAPYVNEIFRRAAQDRVPRNPG
jgi:glycosyltransferase involved in cell wall biosynthesis